MAVVQQVPSVQNKPAAHSDAFAHPAPLGFSPQEYVWFMRLHFEPAMQSVVTVAGAHVVLQALLPQRNSPHDCSVPGTHMPCPLQRPALRSVEVPDEHMAMVHAVLAPHLPQPPLPSHWPLVPQVLAVVAAQSPARSPVPAGTFAHVPTEPEPLQARQVPTHASLQQTPSAQNALAQSAAAVQLAPSPLVPHRPPLQLLPTEHSAVIEHESMQEVPLTLQR